MIPEPSKDAPDLTRQELVELVTDYLEGKLPPEDQERFEAHLAGCRHCRAYLDQMRQTIRLLGRLTDETVPEDAKSQLLRALRTWKQR